MTTVDRPGPTPGQPRPYDFPAFERSRLRNGLDARRGADWPAGRWSARRSLILRNGAADEPAASRGAPRSWPPAPCPRGPSATTRSRWSRRPSGSAPACTRMPAGTPSTVGVEVPGRAARAGPRAARRAGRPPDVPGARGRAPPRRAPERPPPGPGRSAPAGRRGVHRDDLHGELALPPARRAARGDGRAARPRRASRRPRQRGLDPARVTLIMAGDLGGLRRAGAIAERLFGGWSTAAGARPRRPDHAPTPSVGA